MRRNGDNNRKGQCVLLMKIKQVATFCTLIYRVKTLKHVQIFSNSDTTGLRPILLGRFQMVNLYEHEYMSVTYYSNFLTIANSI